MTKKIQNESAQVVTLEETTVMSDALLRASKIREVASDTNKNVSVRIRELHTMGVKMGDIKRALTEVGYRTKNGTEIRFQHVRNVINTPVKKS